MSDLAEPTEDHLSTDDAHEPIGGPDLATVRRLTAVKRALSTQRESDEVDILVTTTLAVLESGPKLREELIREICQSWPGARLTSERAERAIDVAMAANLIGTSQDNLLGEQIHAVAGADAPMQEARAWAQQVLVTTRHDVKVRVEGELNRPMDSTELDAWFNALVAAVSAGIREAFAAYQGKVERVSDLTLIPAKFDRAAINESIDAFLPSNEVRGVIAAMALEAIDPTVPFGTGLVTYLATGYILHAFVARRDLEQTFREAGPLTNQWALLDTPILFGLMERNSHGKSLMQTIQVASEVGMRIVVPEHVLAEFKQVVEYTNEVGSAATIQDALSEGQNPESLRQFASGILSIWLTHTDNEGKVISYDQFSQRCTELVTRLRQVPGVEVYPFNPAKDPQLHRDADECADALDEELISRLPPSAAGSSPEHSRRQRAVEDDGKSMAMLWSHRSGYTGTAWPGGWIITYDTHMGPAFDRVVADSDAALTLTPSQWAVLVGGLARPASERELATAAARLLSQDTFLGIASRYPPSTAIQLARTLAGDERGSEVDTRVAQLSLEELLSEAGDIPVDRDVKAAAALMSKRTRRHGELAQARIAEETRLRSTLETQLTESVGRVELLQEQVDGLAAQLSTQSAAATDQLRASEARGRGERERRIEAEKAREAAAARATLLNREKAAAEGRVEALGTASDAKDDRIEAVAEELKQLRIDQARRRLVGGGAMLSVACTLAVVAAFLWAPWVADHGQRHLILLGGIVASCGAGLAVAWPSQRREMIYTVIVGTALLVGSSLV
jgi:hypothetical protein